MNHEPIIMERLLDAPVKKVWKALTDKEEMKKWYFDMSDFKAQPGFEFSFNGQNEDNSKTFVHLCKVIEAIPEKKLSYTWRYEGYEGESLLTFELFPEGEKTRLKLTHAGLESFPQIPDFAKNNFVQGWNEIIGKMLPNYLQTAL